MHSEITPDSRHQKLVGDVLLPTSVGVGHEPVAVPPDSTGALVLKEVVGRAEEDFPAELERGQVMVEPQPSKIRGAGVRIENLLGP